MRNVTFRPSRSVIPAHKAKAVLFAAVVAGIGLVHSNAASAGTTLYWDPGHTFGTSGSGTGTWDTASSNWYISGPADANWTDVTGTDTAIFGGTAGTYTVTVNGTEYANAITFNSAGYTLSSNTLDLAGTTPTITANSSATINSVISGNAGLTLTGGATLTLGGNNNYTGLTTITAGTLAVTPGISYTTTTSGYSVGSMGTLTYTMPGTGYDNTIAAPITGSGTVNLVNNGYSLHLHADDSAFAGTVNVSGNSTIFLDQTNAGSASAAYVVNSTGNGNGGGSFSAFGLTGPATINLGSLAGTNSSTILGQYTGSGALTWSIGALGTNTSFAGKIISNTMTAGVTKVGNGTLTFSGANTYNGPTNINAGVLSLNNASALGGGGSITFGGGTLQYPSNNTISAVDYSAKIVSSTLGPISIDTNSRTVAFATALAASNTGGLTLNDTNVTPGTLTLSGAAAYTGPTTVTAGTLAITPATSYTTTTSGYSVASGATLTYTMPGTGYDNTIASPITGSGTVNLANNGYSLHLNADDSAFAGTVNVSGNSTIFLDTANAGSASGAYVVNSTGNGNGGGSFSAYGLVGPVTINLGSLAGTTTTTRIGSYTGSGTVTWSIGALGTNTTFAGIIVNNSMTAALTKVGNGTLTLSGANTYTGVTDINAGVLSLNNASALGGGGSITFGGGTLQYPSNNTISAVDYSAKILSSTLGPISIDTNSRTVAFATALAASNTGGLTLNDTNVTPGTLTLSGAAAYTGPTTVTAGTLAITPATSYTTTTSGYSVASGATLTYTMPGTGYDNTIASAITGSGTVNLVNNGYSLHVNANDSAFAGTVNVSGNSTIFLDQTNAGSASAAYVVNSTGNGNGGGSFSGYGLTGPVTINLGSLAGTTTTTRIGSYTGSGTLTWSIGALGTNTTFAGIIVNNSMTAALTKVGGGTLTLGGVNTYTGPTTINASGGTLQIGDPGQLGSGNYAGAIAIGNSGTFEYSSGAAQILSGAISGLGALTKDTGTGVLTLSSATSNYSGLTTVNAGTLAVTPAAAYTTTTSGYSIGSLGTLTYTMPGTGYDNSISSPITGSGVVNLINNGYSLHLHADDSAFAGTINVSGNSTTFLDQTNAGSSTTAYVVNSTGNGNGGGSFSAFGLTGPVTINLGSLAGTTTSTILGQYTGSGALTWSIGALGTNTNFAGKIISNTMTAGVTKVGNGTLTLSGANTYNGPTTISNGILSVTGSLGTTAVAVSSGATLTGTGTIGGAVTVGSGGTITAGTAATSDIGTLTTGGETWGANGTYLWTTTASLPGTASTWGSSVSAVTSDNNQDLLKITGSGILNIQTPFNLDIVQAGGVDSAMPPGNKFIIANVAGGNSDIQVNGIAITGAGSLANAFTVYDGSTGNANNGYGYSVSLDTTTEGNGSTDIEITVTPEPGSLSLLGIASLGLLRRRRIASNPKSQAPNHKQ